MNDKIKQEIQWSTYRIQLLEGVDPKHIPYDAESNIIAVDSLNKVVWKAEPPVTHHEQYYSISIDSNLNLIIANTGGGYRHLINPENGKIVEHYLVK